MEVVDTLLQDEGLLKQKNAVEALEEMKLLLKYCQLFGVADKVRVTALLASQGRGLSDRGMPQT